MPSKLIVKLMDLLGKRTLAVQVMIPCRIARDKLRGRQMLFNKFHPYVNELVEGTRIHDACFEPGVVLDAPRAIQRISELMRKKGTTIEDMYEEAVTGQQGGMPYIWDLLSDQYQRDLAEQWYAYVLITYVDSSDYTIVEELLEAFIARYKFILPDDVTSKPASALHENWREFLIKSAGLVAAFESHMAIPQ